MKSTEKLFPLELLRELADEWNEGYASRHPPGYTLLANKYANIMTGSHQKYPVKLNDLVFREEATGRCWMNIYVREIVYEGDAKGPWFNIGMEPDKPQIRCIEVVPKAVETIEYVPKDGDE